ncbi:MAG: hypothetical protein KDA44_03200 [Planctomycetales bacterium]|nr:hypothetical protein [Planctomycetales bacterium]
MQFSLRGLMLTVTVVAVTCGLASYCGLVFVVYFTGGLALVSVGAVYLCSFIASASPLPPRMYAVSLLVHLLWGASLGGFSGMIAETVLAPLFTVQFASTRYIGSTYCSVGALAAALYLVVSQRNLRRAPIGQSTRLDPSAVGDYNRMPKESCQTSPPRDESKP